MSKLRRGPWSQREDALLISLVQQQGPLNWVKISDTLLSRSPKQCRERYHQNLKPSLNHEPISAEEGQLIEKLVGELGKRWAEIARRLNNRSDNAVKNWWNGSQNRRKRLLQRRRVSHGYDGHHQTHHHPAAPLDHPRRPQLELATGVGATRIFSANHRHEPVSPCTVNFSHAMHNAPPPSGLPSPNSDRVLYPFRPYGVTANDTTRPAFRSDSLLPPVAGSPNLRLPPIQTLKIGERHPLPTAPNSPLEPVSSSTQQEYDPSHRLSWSYSDSVQRRSSQGDEGDSRLRVSNLVD
ncbi:hypothetical protein CIB48_g7422 [Xylaria polymorpha]|nr:hypothetical protein CIB48_g7422 [Xylaria polymorpha]